MSDINLWEVIVAKFDKLDERLESFEKAQAEANIIAAKQEVNLEQHMKRTEMLESRMEPVERHINILNGALKAIGAGAVVVSLITGILKLLEYVRH